MKTGLHAAAAVLWMSAGAAMPALAHDVDGSGAKLGKVHFEVACNAAAQKDFDLAMAYYHSFAWAQISDPLDHVLKADSTCGMAHWARALSLLDNPFGWPVNLSPK